MIISGTFIILYGLALYFWRKKVTWRLNHDLSKWIRYSHYFLFLLTFIATLLNVFYLSFRGQWTTRVIVIGFLLSGIFIFPASDWASRPKLEKNYYRVFSFLPILTAAISMIPFLGILIVLSLFGRLVQPVDNIYYQDNKLRVQSTFTGALAPPRLDIIEKNGLLESRLNRTHRSAVDIDSVSIQRGSDETLVILYRDMERRDTIKIKQ